MENIASPKWRKLQEPEIRDQAIKNPLQTYHSAHNLMLLRPINDIRRKEYVSNGSDTSYQNSVLRARINISDIAKATDHDWKTVAKYIDFDALDSIPRVSPF